MIVWCFGWETAIATTVLSNSRVGVCTLWDASRNCSAVRSEDDWPNRSVTSSGHTYWFWYMDKKLLGFQKTPFSMVKATKRKVEVARNCSKSEFSSGNVESGHQKRVSDQSHSFLSLYHNQKVLGKIFWEWFCNFPGLLSVAKSPSKNLHTWIKSRSGPTSHPNNAPEQRFDGIIHPCQEINPTEIPPYQRS